MKLSDYVIRFIAEQGVKHVFMLPGGGAMHLVDSLGRCKDIEYICNLHEQACAIAAEAYARFTNNLGVVLVTTGPGGTNTITGVAGAWLESTPCLFVSGQVKRSDMKKDLGVRQIGPQELDIVSLVKTITKYAITVTEPTSIKYHLEKAVALAKSGRPGPVWIDIPLDIQASQINPVSLDGFDKSTLSNEASDSVNLVDKIAQTIDLLNQSERPVLLVGNGVRIAGAHDICLQMIDLLQIPVLTTWTGKDILGDAHPLYFGSPGIIAPRGPNFTLQNADMLITIGARLDFAITGFDKSLFARAAKKVIVDIDETELRKFQILIDIPICSDAMSFIDEVLHQSSSIRKNNRSSWFKRCKEWKEKYPIVISEYWSQKKYVNSYLFTTILSELLDTDDIIVPGSSGSGIDTFFLSFKVKQGQRVYNTGGLGAMGFGIPASIGGCIASGRKRTICVDGDGGFQLNIQELETVARLNLPIKYFVLNNQGYASIRVMQQNHFGGHLVACDSSSGLTLPDVVKLAKAYGIEAIRIRNHKNLKETITGVLQSPDPCVCDVMIDPNQLIGPRVSSYVRPDGSIISKPLEDLWPFLDRKEFFHNMIIPTLEE
jgi:acetolactate synthase-1/2/3 large subunit